MSSLSTSTFCSERFANLSQRIEKELVFDEISLSKRLEELKSDKEEHPFRHNLEIEQLENRLNSKYIMSDAVGMYALKLNNSPLVQDFKSASKMKFFGQVQNII